MGVDPGLHVLSLQGPATPSPVGLGSGQHIVWEATSTALSEKRCQP